MAPPLDEVKINCWGPTSDTDHECLEHVRGLEQIVSKRGTDTQPRPQGFSGLCDHSSPAFDVFASCGKFHPKSHHAVGTNGILTALFAQPLDISFHIAPHWLAKEAVVSSVPHEVQFLKIEPQFILNERCLIVVKSTPDLYCGWLSLDSFTNWLFSFRMVIKYLLDRVNTAAAWITGILSVAYAGWTLLWLPSWMH